jgi:putative ABC transport system permease protein
MRTLLLDVQFAVRLLRQRPGFTLTALLALSLATGANTAVFSLVYSVVLRPLPFPEPSRLVSITEFYPLFNQSVVTSPAYFDWRDGNAGAARLAAYSMSDYTLTTGDVAERIPAALVSYEFFNVLGIRPKWGRIFSEAEDRPGADGVVIVSEGFWSERMGRDASVLSHRIELDGRSYTIVGVMPESFGFPPAVRIWILLALNSADRAQGGPVQLVRVIARLAPRTTPSGLSATLEAISQRSTQTWTAGTRIVLVPLRAWLTGKTQQVWFILLAVVGMVLLIACANVAGLLIARGADRRREMAIRLALGAPASHLTRQVLTESLLLGLLGSAAGLVLAAGLLHALLPLIPDSMLAGRPVHLDGPVFAFTALVAIITALLFGAAPARVAVRVDLSDSLKQGGHTATPAGRIVEMRSALVAAEIALCLSIVVTASLMVRSFIAMTEVDPGFRPDHMLTLSVNLPTAAYREASRQHQFYGQMIEAAASLPGVRAAGIVSALPFSGASAARALVTAEGEPPWGAAEGERHRVESLYVSSNYFDAMGIPFLEGRTLAAGEMTQSGQAVVINESMARRFFGRSTAASRRIKMGLAESPAPWLSVVGVIRDSKRTALDDDAAPTIFRPYQQSSSIRSAGLVLRCGPAPESITEAARRAIAGVDRDVPVSDAQSMERRLSNSMASSRLRSISTSLLAFLAIAIVLTGLYGVLSYIVSQRTTELGVRIALGATPSNIFAIVLRQGIVLAMAGTLVGVALSMTMSRFLRGLLFTVGPSDPFTLITASGGMLAIIAAACIVPARRAIRIDPIRCLRQE